MATAQDVNKFLNEDGECDLLQEPLNIAELLAGGSLFEISNDFNEFNAKTNAELFDDFGAGSDDDDDEEVKMQQHLSPWNNLFSDLKDQMDMIDNGIYKKIVTRGSAGFGSVPKQNGRVTISYNSYREKHIAPIDSTYLRGAHQILYTGIESILPGLEMAILSMKKGEISQFLISYKLLFGEIGVPPRIPPKCDLLFVIEMINFKDIGNENAMDEVAYEDRRTYRIIYPKVKELHQKGKDFFESKNYDKSVKLFLQASRNLDNCTVADENEENQRQEMLIKMYLNLATCYSKKDLPRRVLTFLNNLRRINEQAYNKNCKALYYEGKSLYELGEHRRAKICLNKALRLEASNIEIQREMKKVIEAEEKHKKFEKELCERTFGAVNIANKRTEEVRLSRWEVETKKSLEDFKNDTKTLEMKYPEGLQSSENVLLQKLINDVGLRIQHHAGAKYIRRGFKEECS